MLPPKWKAARKRKRRGPGEILATGVQSWGQIGREAAASIAAGIAISPPGVNYRRMWVEWVGDEEQEDAP